MAAEAYIEIWLYGSATMWLIRRDMRRSAVSSFGHQMFLKLGFPKCRCRTTFRITSRITSRVKSRVTSKLYLRPLLRPLLRLLLRVLLGLSLKLLLELLPGGIRVKKLYDWFIMWYGILMLFRIYLGRKLFKYR